MIFVKFLRSKGA
uniref:Uncharacterized protein n=1 Tax=Arundo donax TaxID=35708 RepID=A0A0A9HGI6_ARUDO